MLYDRPYYREPAGPQGLQGRMQTIKGWSAVKTLIVANVIVFLIQMVLPMNWMLEHFALIPAKVIHQGYVWTLVTAGFMHGNVMHILFNMIGLYVFGEMIEKLYGKKWLLLFYFFCLIGSSLMVVGFDAAAGRLAKEIPTVGASGAVFGLLAAAALLFPNRQLILLLMFIIPVRLKIKWLAIGYLVIWLLGLRAMLEGQSNISHIGHLGGMIFGGGYFLAVRYGLISVGAGGYYGAMQSQQAGRRTSWFKGLLSGFTKPFRKIHPSGWRSWPDHEIRAEMDRVLAKVSQSGIQSLSGRERKFLTDVSEYFRNKDR